MLRTPKLTGSLPLQDDQLTSLGNSSEGRLRSSQSRRAPWSMAVDVKETGDSIFFVADVPGLTQDTLKVNSQPIL